MNESNLEKLRNLKSEIARQAAQEGDFESVINSVGTPSSQEEEDLLAGAHYGLLKRLSTLSRYDEATEHGRAALPLVNHRLRYFIDQRIRLMRHGVTGETVRKSGTRLVKGIALVDGFGMVPVLGIYGTRSLRGTTNNLIDLLKKASSELEPWEREARQEAVREVGIELWSLLQSLPWDEEIDAIVPIPPDPERYAVRGYSVTDELAAGLSAASKVPKVNLLIKTQSTPDLRGLGPADRRAVLQGSIAIDDKRSDLIPESRLLLVDDVVTYGTHFSEGRWVLTQAGAAEVYATAIASARDNVRRI